MNTIQPHDVVLGRAVDRAAEYVAGLLIEQVAQAGRSATAGAPTVDAQMEVGRALAAELHDYVAVLGPDLLRAVLTVAGRDRAPVWLDAAHGMVLEAGAAATHPLEVQPAATPESEGATRPLLDGNDPEDLLVSAITYHVLRRRGYEEDALDVIRQLNIPLTVNRLAAVRACILLRRPA